MRRRQANKIWDLCAVTLSSACMLHCLGLPILVTMLPVLSMSTDSHLMHLVMVMLAAPVTLWVVWTEYSAQNNSAFIILALAGLSLMIAAVTLPSLEEFEVTLTLSGGTLLAGAHLWRWSRYQSHQH